MGLFFSRLNSLFEGGRKEESAVSKLPAYITRADAARILNVSCKTIDRYVKLGKLPKHTLGESTRFLQTDVEGLIR